MPLISIGIPCHNAASTITRTLDCALAQDWGNKEILVVDDGSTDNSVEIVQSYSAVHPNITLICHTENKGTPVARNTLLKSFHGDYLAFFDADDYSYPSRLREQFECLNASGRNPRALLCFTNLEYVSAGSTEPSRIVKGLGWAPPEPTGEMLAAKFFLDKSQDGYSFGLPGTGCMMGHKEVFSSVGEFDPRLLRYQDLDYTLRAGMQGYGYVAVDKVMVRYYIHTGKGKKGKIVQSHLVLTEKYKEFLRTHRMYIYSLIMARAKAHEFCGNKWRFKITRSLAKRVRKIASLFGER